MPHAEYNFLTHWEIRGPIQKIYDILKAGDHYADWWRPAYQRTDRLGPEKVGALVRARLPYTLKFSTELVSERPPEEIEIRAWGELEGRGLWCLRQEAEITKVDFHWDVCARKRMVRWLSPFLKPLFRWNHDWVMKTGELCLQAEINRVS